MPIDPEVQAELNRARAAFVDLNSRFETFKTIVETAVVKLAKRVNNLEKALEVQLRVESLSGQGSTLTRRRITRLLAKDQEQE